MLDGLWPPTLPLQTMILRLVPCAPARDSADVLLMQFPVLVGRSPRATLRLDDRWVSRHHCCLECDHGELVIRDLGSRHGTLVNGCCVREAPLHAGDRLAIGLSTFVVEFADSSAGAARVEAAEQTAAS